MGLFRMKSTWFVESKAFMFPEVGLSSLDSSGDPSLQLFPSPSSRLVLGGAGREFATSPLTQSDGYAPTQDERV